MMLTLAMIPTTSRTAAQTSTATMTTAETLLTAIGTTTEIVALTLPRNAVNTRVAVQYS